MCSIECQEIREAGSSEAEGEMGESSCLKRTLKYLPLPNLGARSVFAEYKRLPCDSITKFLVEHL